MTATRRSVSKRASRSIAVATFTIGLAIGIAAIASAEWDIEAYDKCMDDPNTDTSAEFERCCTRSGGVVALPPGNCKSPPVNEQMTGQPAPPRSPEDIVGGPVRDFNAPDAVVPGGPVLELPTP